MIRSQRERTGISLHARLAGAVVPASIAAGGVVLYWGSEVRLRAPFSGLTLTAIAIALIATGYAGRGLVGVLLAGAAAALGLAVDEFIVTADVEIERVPDDACDPGCDFGWSLGAILLVPPLVLGAVGAGARALLERRRRFRRQRTP